METNDIYAIEEELHPWSYFPFGTHLCRSAWERYHVVSLLQSREGGSSIYALRELAAVINRTREAAKSSLPPVSAAHLATAGLLLDVLRYVIDQYCTEENPGVTGKSMDWTRDTHGEALAVRPIQAFVHLYPATTVKQGQIGESEFLRQTTRSLPNPELVLWESVLLHLCTHNRAMRPFLDLFDDTELEQHARYSALVKTTESFFSSQPELKIFGMRLFEVLKAPMAASPDSLDGQLEFMLKNWEKILPARLVKRLLLAKDVLKEETQVRSHGPGPSAVLSFGRAAALVGYTDYDYPEPERFSRDLDWMANVVLLAKSTHVWLNQLSEIYQRPITQLDHVPDEELDKLARWGFSGLWLIGLWERSPASAHIKRSMGNPEALSSAYSLYDYTISGDLGGEPAWRNLRDRAWAKGIRLASDMVPNHMGIYSRWVVEHPDWFLQLEQPPYPNYQFTGGNLSHDPRVTIQLEDGYWNHRDAAVVFKHTDNGSGRVRYIYHGNDGTSMPWNDTAQLNYLLAHVREAVIQTILAVARQFPIIRFDAAMTLAKKHFQRLWFPKQGEGGAIPSRSEHSMSRAEFEAYMPEEFWREVVDRIHKEAPETLLLAEAFWLMEGYFVRTLGMHRVYNSAFMNMLKMEENAKYRATMKNVLEFSPEVLKRFVNFMSNPDEKTAVEQFGRGDKYYGAAVLMVTMPGLPMFGHGQIEGYTEKYGMEYGRAYWNEPVDEHMVYRHETEIFPLMRRRYLFSHAENFVLYDFETGDGQVDENVFAYSNRAGNERALILFHNAYRSTRGSIRKSVAINKGTPEQPYIVHPSLEEGLNLRGDDNVYYVFHDYKSHLEYLRQGRHLAEDGLYFELEAYQYVAFINLREIHDSDGTWGRLAYLLQGRSVPSVDLAYREMILAPVLQPLRGVLSRDVIQSLATAMVDSETFDAAFIILARALDVFLEARGGRYVDQSSRGKVIAELRDEMEILRTAETQIAGIDIEPCIAEYFTGLVAGEGDAESDWHVPLAWLLLRHLAEPITGDPSVLNTPDWMDHWLITPILAEAFSTPDRDEFGATIDAQLVKLAYRHQKLLSAITDAERNDSLQALLSDPAARDFLCVNEHAGVTWINKENIESLVRRLFFFAATELLLDDAIDAEDRRYEITSFYNRCIEIIDVAGATNYQVARMVSLLG